MTVALIGLESFGAPVKFCKQLFDAVILFRMSLEHVLAELQLLLSFWSA